MNPIPPVMSVVMLVLPVPCIVVLWLRMACCDTWEAKPALGLSYPCLGRLSSAHYVLRTGRRWGSAGTSLACHLQVVYADTTT